MNSAIASMRAINSITSSLRTLQAAKHLHSSASLQSVQMDISGMYPPITTPFDKDEHIDFVALKENMQKWNKIPFRGYVVQGSNGEYAYMSAAERVDLVGRVADMMADDRLLIAGSGCESTRATIEMTNNMADAGAALALVITPCFYKSGMTDDAMFEHFTSVANQSKIPIILYSVPANTGIDLNAEVIVKLSMHPNIVGLKDSGGDIAKLGSVVYRTKNNCFQVLAGSASFLYAAYHLGCVGGVCALANVLGNECCEVGSLFASKQWAEAEELQKRLIIPNIDVTRKFGVPGLKQAMDWLGYVGGPTRMPLLPLTTNQQDVLRSDFKHAGFL